MAVVAAAFAATCPALLPMTKADGSVPAPICSSNMIRSTNTATPSAGFGDAERVKTILSATNSGLDTSNSTL
ncbi:hypothetical protein D3C77_377400 [compost metagenome]